MKSTLKTTVMSLVAMFALATVADAQTTTIDLGGLGKAFGIKSKKEKAMEKIKPTIPQPEKGKVVTVKWNKNKVGQWDPSTLKLTFNQTYDEGQYKGQNVTFLLDPQTGKWTNIAGNVIGQMSNDGTMQTPNLGTIKLNQKTYEVTMGSEVIGNASVNDASCYGFTMGEMSGGYVSPLLMAYVFHGIMLSKDQVSKLKVLRQQADAEAAAQAAAQAKAREEAAKRAAAQRSSSSSSSSSSSQTKYTAVYYNGQKFKVDVYNSFHDDRSNQMGSISYGGSEVTVYSKKEGAVAWIKSDGRVSLNSRFSFSGSGEVRGNEIYLKGNNMF